MPAFSDGRNNMVLKIALKDNALFGAGSGEDVSFSSGFTSLETFEDQTSFNARLKELENSNA
jgi:hypothetical protein